MRILINQERRQVQKYKNLLSRTGSFMPLGIHQLLKIQLNIFENYNLHRGLNTIASIDSSHIRFKDKSAVFKFPFLGF